MSKKDKTKSSSSSTSASTATATPNVPAWMQGPARDYYSQIGSLLTQGPGAPTAAQQSGFNLVRSLGSNQGLNDAMGATRSLISYTPENVRTNWNANTIAGPNGADYTASLMDAAPDVIAGQLRDTDLTSYLNPYTQEVIDRSIGDLERGRQGAIAYGQGAATQASAYGGSRHGVADSLTNREFADSAGNLAAGLRQAGFQNAQTAALSDIGNRFAADRFNTENAMTVGARNQDARNEFLRSLLSDRMTAQLANQGAAENADSRTMQGQLANQQAGLSGAGFRLGAANQLGAQAATADANTRANAQAQIEMGAMDDPAQQRIRFLAQLQQLLGFDPSQFIGSTLSSNSTGTQRGTSTTGSSGMSWSDIGSIAQGVAAVYGMSDRRLKKDIAPIGERRGVPWYTFRFVWEDDDAPLREGVMADEAPAHAVAMHPSGYAMVNYAAL